MVIFLRKDDCVVWHNIAPVTIRYSYAILYSFDRHTSFAKKSFLSTMGKYYRGNSLAQCWSIKIRVTLQIIFLRKVVHGLWVNIAQVTFLCNVGTGRLRQHCIGYFSHKSCLFAMSQHCTGDFPVQC